MTLCVTVGFQLILFTSNGRVLIKKITDKTMTLDHYTSPVADQKYIIFIKEFTLLKL